MSVGRSPDPLTPGWRAAARSGERAPGSDHCPPVWRAAGALGKGHSAGSPAAQGAGQCAAGEHGCGSCGAAGNTTINDSVALPRWLELAEVRADTFLPER